MWPCLLEPVRARPHPLDLVERRGVVIGRVDSHARGDVCADHRLGVSDDCLPHVRQVNVVRRLSEQRGHERPQGSRLGPSPRHLRSSERRWISAAPVAAEDHRQSLGRFKQDRWETVAQLGMLASPRWARLLSVEPAVQPRAADLPPAGRKGMSGPNHASARV